VRFFNNLKPAFLQEHTLSLPRRCQPSPCQNGIKAASFWYPSILAIYHYQKSESILWQEFKVLVDLCLKLLVPNFSFIQLYNFYSMENARRRGDLIETAQWDRALTRKIT